MSVVPLCCAQKGCKKTERKHPNQNKKKVKPQTPSKPFIVLSLLLVRNYFIFTAKHIALRAVLGDIAGKEKSKKKKKQGTIRLAPKQH